MKQTAPITVLVVEDEQLINWDVADVLRAGGFDVIQAYTGEEAIASLEGRTDVRVVFTDISLPGKIDGIALAIEVARRWPQIEVLMTSAHKRREAEKLDLVANYGRFVPKPYPPQAIARRIHEIIDAAA